MKEIELPKITDESGNLSFFEGEKSIPFKIKSVNLFNIYIILMTNMSLLIIKMRRSNLNKIIKEGEECFLTII